MNYERIYKSIIEKRALNHPFGVFERHHVIPRCMGGSDNDGNIVSLTPREHFICHHLLAKIYPGPLCRAYFFMSHPRTNSAVGIRVTARQYAVARKNYISHLKTMTGFKNPNYGNSYSESARNKISNARKKYAKRNHPLALNERVDWVHSSGEIFNGSHFDLSEAARLDADCLRRVSKGSVFSYKGWSCPSSGREDMRSGDNTNTSDKNIYTWISPDGIEFKGTRHYIREKFGLNYNGTSNLVRGIIKKHKGWSICL